MIWVTWRQFRTTILAAVGGILTLAAIALICGTISGSHSCWADTLTERLTASGQ